MKDLQFVTKIMVYSLDKIPIFRPLKNRCFDNLKSLDFNIDLPSTFCGPILLKKKQLNNLQCLTKVMAYWENTHFSTIEKSIILKS